jgi:hypothetical protein
LRGGKGTDCRAAANQGFPGGGIPTRQAERQRGRVDLAQLEVVHAGLLFDHGGQRHGQDGDPPSAWPRHHQGIVAAPLHLDHRHRAAAGTGRLEHRDLVAEVVADQWLHGVGQVGEQG